MNTERLAHFPDCTVLTEAEYPAWDHFVSEHPGASPYHLSIWRHIIERAFGKRWYVVGAVQHGRVLGGIPLVHMKSPLFGNFLGSMPYFNYGGVLVNDECMAEPILERTISLAQELGVNHLELRHLENHYPHLPVKTGKVSMWLDLPSSSTELMKSFKPKLRSQVRKGEKNGLGVKEGGIELLDDFYTVFVHNMRDLGTPVYGKIFMQLILEAFPKTARLIIVTDSTSRPIAGGFLLGFRDRVEIPWASSLREYNHLQSNMFLYWNCLQYACDQGYGVFDFGRSSMESSTFKFKAQWGAQPVQHHWHYWLPNNQDMPEMNPQNPKYQLAISLWQRLPVSVTRVVGPLIAKHLP